MAFKLAVTRVQNEKFADFLAAYHRIHATADNEETGRVSIRVVVFADKEAKDMWLAQRSRTAGPMPNPRNGNVFLGDDTFEIPKAEFDFYVTEAATAGIKPEDLRKAAAYRALAAKVEKFKAAEAC